MMAYTLYNNYRSHIWPKKIHAVKKHHLNNYEHHLINYEVEYEVANRCLRTLDHAATEVTVQHLETEANLPPVTRRIQTVGPKSGENQKEKWTGTETGTGTWTWTGTEGQRLNISMQDKWIPWCYWSVIIVCDSHCHAAKGDDLPWCKQVPSKENVTTSIVFSIFHTLHLKHCILESSFCM